MNIASLKQLPILYCIESNQVATSTPNSHRHSMWLSQLQKRTNWYWYANGADVYDVMDAAHTALRHLPAVLEVNVRRYCGHVGGEIKHALGDCMDPLRKEIEPADAQQIREEVDADLGRLGF